MIYECCDEIIIDRMHSSRCEEDLRSSSSVVDEILRSIASIYCIVLEGMIICIMDYGTLGINGQQRGGR